MGFLIDISDDAIANPCPIPISKFQTCQKNFGCSNEFVSCGLRHFCGIKSRASDAQIIEHLKKIIACQTASDLNDRPNIKRTMHFENMCCPTRHVAKRTIPRAGVVGPKGKTIGIVRHNRAVQFAVLNCKVQHWDFIEMELFEGM